MSVRVAYLIPEFPALSETFVAAEIERLQQLGCELHVISFTRPPRADLEKLGRSTCEIVDSVTYIDSREAVSAAAAAPAAVARGWGESQRLKRCVTRKASSNLRLMRAVAVARRVERAGISHVHAHWPYASQVAHLVHVISGITYSVSVHAHEVAHDYGHFPLIFARLSFAAFCNRGAMEYLLNHLGDGARSRSHLVYHGVDLTRFTVQELPSRRTPFNVVSAGRLTRTKGFERLIRACAQCRSEGLDIHLTILGRGMLESHLRAIAAELSFTEHLTMPGWVSHEDVRRHLQEAHVFALLADTSFHDGLPNVVLEAMASGRAIILSALPAAAEAVTNGREGFILENADDTGGFAAAIRRLTSDPQLARSMGQAARQRVEADHDAAAQVRRMTELFQAHVKC